MVVEVVGHDRVVGRHVVRVPVDVGQAEAVAELVLQRRLEVERVQVGERHGDGAAAGGEAAVERHTVARVEVLVVGDEEHHEQVLGAVAIDAVGGEELLDEQAGRRQPLGRVLHVPGRVVREWHHVGRGVDGEGVLALEHLVETSLSDLHVLGEECALGGGGLALTRRDDEHRLDAHGAASRVGHARQVREHGDLTADGGALVDIGWLGSRVGSRIDVAVDRFCSGRPRRVGDIGGLALCSRTTGGHEEGGEEGEGVPHELDAHDDGGRVSFSSDDRRCPPIARGEGDLHPPHER